MGRDHYDYEEYEAKREEPTEVWTGGCRDEEGRGDNVQADIHEGSLI